MHVMADLTSQERLQPSLLDRLTDRARYRERVEMSIPARCLEGAGMGVADFNRLMDAHGFALVNHWQEQGERVEVREAASSEASIRQVLQHRFKPQPRAAELTVSDLVVVRQRQLIANTSESRRDRVVSGGQLRESVMRDLGWLLNTGNLSSVRDLSHYGAVESSVLNFGIPELAGVTASSADVVAVAEGIRAAIERFEPRLTKVRVLPRADDRASGNRLGFVVEADLWGQPMSQHLYLHTELDLESASASVRDAGGGD